MVDGYKSLDLGFPQLSSDESAKEQIAKVYKYLLQMKEGMRVALQTMDKRIRILETEKRALIEENETLRSQIRTREG